MRFFLYLLGFCLFFANSLFAEEMVVNSYKVVDDKDLFTMTDSQGKKVQCWIKEEQSFVYAQVRKSKGTLLAREINITKRLTKLKFKIQTAQIKSEKSKLKRKRKSMIVQFANLNELCSSPVNQIEQTPLPTISPTPITTIIITPTPTPIPTQIPEEFSLDTLDRSLTKEDIRYLAEKAGFGFGPREKFLLDIGTKQGATELVKSFTAIHDEDEGLTELTEGMLDLYLKATTYDEFGQPHVWVDGIQNAWLYRMEKTNNPFFERFAWFLLSVWTVDDTNVSTDETLGRTLWAYITKIRQATYEETDMLALGKLITIDPYMLVYLSGASNDAKNPNENFARELLELFTLGTEDLDGKPNYTEVGGDITKFALALTGWKVQRIDGLWRSFFDPLAAIKKDIMVFEGTPYECQAASSLDSSNTFRALDCIFKHPNVSKYYAQEILKFYVTPNPPIPLVENFAKIIESNHWNLVESMRTLLSSKAFFHENYRGTTVKDSVHFSIEFIKTLSFPSWTIQDIGNTTAKDINPYSLKDLLKRHQAIAGSKSVFWWPEEYKSSPPTLIEKHNTIAITLRHALKVYNKWDWTFNGDLPINNTAITDKVVVQYFIDKLGIEISEDDFKQLIFYMNNNLNNNGTYTKALYDHKNASMRNKKIRGLLNILSMHPSLHTT